MKKYQRLRTQNVGIAQLKNYCLQENQIYFYQIFNRPVNQGNLRKMLLEI